MCPSGGSGGHSEDLEATTRFEPVQILGKNFAWWKDPTAKTTALSGHSFTLQYSSKLVSAVFDGRETCKKINEMPDWQKKNQKLTVFWPHLFF